MVADYITTFRRSDAACVPEREHHPTGIVSNLAGGGERPRMAGQGPTTGSGLHRLPPDTRMAVFAPQRPCDLHDGYGRLRTGAAIRGPSRPVSRRKSSAASPCERLSPLSSKSTRYAQSPQRTPSMLFSPRLTIVSCRSQGFLQFVWRILAVLHNGANIGRSRLNSDDKRLAIGDNR